MRKFLPLLFAFSRAGSLIDLSCREYQLDAYLICQCNKFAEALNRFDESRDSEQAHVSIFCFFISVNSSDRL